MRTGKTMARKIELSWFQHVADVGLLFLSHQTTSTAPASTWVGAASHPSSAPSSAPLSPIRKRNCKRRSCPSPKPQQYHEFEPQGSPPGWHAACELGASASPEHRAGTRRRHPLAVRYLSAGTTLNLGPLYWGQIRVPYVVKRRSGQSFDRPQRRLHFAKAHPRQFKSSNTSHTLKDLPDKNRPRLLPPLFMPTPCETHRKQTLGRWPGILSHATHTHFRLLIPLTYDFCRKSAFSQQGLGYSFEWNQVCVDKHKGIRISSPGTKPQDDGRRGRVRCWHERRDAGCHGPSVQGTQL